MVDVHARYGLARRIGAPIFAAGQAAAHGMVEDEDPMGAGEFLQELLGLLVVGALDLRSIVEVANGAFVLDECEALLVQRHL